MEQCGCQYHYANYGDNVDNDGSDDCVVIVTSGGTICGHGQADNTAYEHGG